MTTGSELRVALGNFLRSSKDRADTSTLLELLDRTLERCWTSEDLAAEGALKRRLTANDWFKQSLFNVVIARTPDNRGNGACHCDCAERRALSRWPRLFTTRLHVVHRLSDREQPIDTICLLTLGTPLTLPFLLRVIPLVLTIHPEVANRSRVSAAISWLLSTSGSRASSSC